MMSMRPVGSWGPYSNNEKFSGHDFSDFHTADWEGSFSSSQLRDKRARAS